MTKDELINKIASRAGIPGESAREFFDFFLREMSFALRPGESAQYGSLGFFHFRRGKTKKKVKLEKNEPEYEYLDLIIYSKESSLNLSSGENIIFIVPSDFIESKHELDSHFSLSLDKPVMPQLDDSVSGSTIQQSAISSSDDLKGAASVQIKEIKKLPGAQSDKNVLLISSLGEGQFNLEIDESAATDSSQEQEEKGEIHSSDVMKSRAWDYGKILSKRVEEHSFLEIDEKKDESETPAEKVDEDIIPWNFGKKRWTEIADEEISEIIEPTEQTAPEAEENQTLKTEEKIQTEENKSALPEEHPEEPKIDMKDFKVSGQEEKDKIGNYERVRSVSAKFNDAGNIDAPGKGIKDFIKETHHEDEKEEEAKAAAKIKAEEEKKKVKQAKKEKPPKKKRKKPKEIKLNRYERNRRQRKSALPFFIFLIVLAAIIAGVYYYMNSNKKAPVETENAIPYAERNANTTYIERSYEIPVTYPYKKTDVSISGIDIPTEEKPEVKNVQKPDLKTEKKTTKKPVNEKSTSTKRNGERPADTFTQVEYNIYQYGNVYAVQIAAFRSEKVAQGVAQKYSNRGYNGFVEEAILAGRGTWYRVRVGNFKTVKEARKFLESYRNK